MLSVKVIKARHSSIYNITSIVRRHSASLKRCYIAQAYWRVVSASEQMASNPRGRLRSEADLMLRRSDVILSSPLREGIPTLRVFQWNTLADGLAQNGDFVKVSPAALEWAYRAPLLLKEIMASAADIVCLQEVNRFEDFFKPELARVGYVGYFWPKPCSPAEPYACPCDGCAVFFKASRFQAVGDVSARPFHARDGNGMGNQGMLHVELVDKQTGVHLIVACTHLKAKGGQENDAARKHQVAELVDRIRCASEPKSNGNGVGPVRPLVLICGDFNTTPDNIACKVVEESGLGLQSLWDVRPSGEGEGCGSGEQPAQPENVFTTWKFRGEGEVRRIIDYIWFSTDLRLRPLSRWRTPTLEEIGPGGLPNDYYPSDHLSICCEFEVLGSAKQ